MTEIILNTNVVSDAQDKLLWQFRTAEASPNLMDFIGAIAEEFQELENVSYSLIVDRYLDNATGKTLEYIGGQVGMPKPVSGPGSNNDDIYRLLIKAKIAENCSDGTTPELQQILGIFGATDIKTHDIPYAAIEFNIFGENIIAPLSYIKDALIRASDPVEIDLSKHDLTGYFGFAGDPRALGFGVGTMGGTT